MATHEEKRTEILELMAHVGGPDAAVNFILAAMPGNLSANPPPIMDQIADAIRNGGEENTIVLLVGIGKTVITPGDQNTPTTVQVYGQTEIVTIK